jgi:uncharacterized protein YjeT (DUF2065 family)
MKLRLTHLSLWYLPSYVLPAGLTLLLAPNLALKMFMSNTQYQEEPMRLAGIALFSLGILVTRMIWLKQEALYTTTLPIRVFIVSGLGWLYATSGNPFFAVLIGIVGLGLVLTTTAYLVDRKRAA